MSTTMTQSYRITILSDYNSTESQPSHNHDLIDPQYPDTPYDVPHTCKRDG